MSHGFHRHVRLDNTERSRLLCRLDESPLDPRGQDRRRFTRWEYRVSDIAVIVQHPGGGSGRFLVCTRNISDGGVSFIHGGYIHLGSECRILLPRRSGGPLGVAGVVVHCRYVEGAHHEIGIQFLKPIDARVLLAGAGPDDSGRDHAVELPSITGRALVVDESELDRRLIAHQIGATGLEMNMVSTPDAALDAVRREKFEIILCELGIEADGVRMIEQMRSQGVTIPIIVVTVERDVARLRAARKAGANEIVGKPCAPEYLAWVLAEWLEVPMVQHPITSDHEDKAGMAESIAQFVKRAKRTGEKIAKAVDEENAAAARELVPDLVSSGTGFGFSSLSKIARDAMTALDTSVDFADAARVLRRLISACKRVCPLDDALGKDESPSRSVA